MYSGYLLKIGNWKVPYNFIQPEGFKTSDQPEKIAEWVDYCNNRHVTYSQNTVPVVTFVTEKNFLLHEEHVEQIRDALRNAKNDDGSYVLTYYSVTDGEYKTGNFTLENTNFTISGVNDDDIFYNPITFTFKGGVVNGS